MATKRKRFRSDRPRKVTETEIRISIVQPDGSTETWDFPIVAEGFSLAVVLSDLEYLPHDMRQAFLAEVTLHVDRATTVES
jgi:hypothetical protein